jgi:carboxyl-terminal processing protease
MINRMPFSYDFRPRRNAPNAAIVFITAFAAFLVGLGIGIGQGLKVGERTALAIGQGQPANESFAGSILGWGSDAPKEKAGDVEFGLFWDVWSDVRDRYYRQPVEERGLFYGAIQGMTDALGDPYSIFFRPSEAEEFTESLRGEFSGIGAEIGTKDGNLQIIAPLPDSPAERAGIRARDLIVSIDGVDSLNAPVEEAVMRIRGEKGTDVVLTLGRERGTDGEIELFDVTITRDTIIVKSARMEDLGGGIFLIEIFSFNEDAADTFMGLADEAIARNAKGLIIDVRNNPGGYLDGAVSVAGEWLKGEVVVQQSRQGEVTEKLRGTGRGALKNMPTAVLVNEGSASAAEILAGALQDYGLATIVGAKTFGKGSVQDFVEYADGSALKITVSEWLTPNGRSIDEQGIEPDVEVQMTEEDYDAGNDPQLDKAVEIVKSR